MGEDRLIEPALSGYPVGWFAPTYKMMAEVWRDLRRILLPVTTRVDAQQHRIELAGGGLVELWSLDTPDVARGRKYRRVILDEAAMIRDLETAWQAVIRPTLADYQGDAWILSTPKGRNYFWRMYSWGQDPDQPEWMSWQMPTAANPYIQSDEIEAMRRTMPERTYTQEVLAAFTENDGGVFRRVREAATAAPADRAVPGHDYVFGADWGQSQDFTVITVLDATDQAVVAIDRFNQIDYTVQVGRLQALAGRFHPILIVAERNSMGQPVIEQIERLGLPVQPFTTTNASKKLAIDSLALAFEQQTIRIIGEPTLIDELEAYEMERLPSGLMRYSAPAGMHDDCVMSLALAWHGVTGGMTLLGDDLASDLAGFTGI